MRTQSATGPRWPILGRLTHFICRRAARLYCKAAGLYDGSSRMARQTQASLKDRLARGETVYLAGLGVAGHNSGIALVEVSLRTGLRLLGNDEEERFSGIKHYAGFPKCSIESFHERLRRLGLTPRDIHAYLTSFDYPAVLALGARALVDHLPASLTLLRPAASPTGNFGHFLAALKAPRRLAAQLGLERAPPLLGVNHHDSHAAFSWAVSPFARSDRPVLVSVVDGFGDDGSMAMYLAEGGRLRCLWRNESLFDSIGIFYSAISSSQGGWTPLSSEGRYMGAAAWGDNDRLTNPYYRMLREIFHFGPGGEILLNRRLANWVRAGDLRPYTRELEAILGPPVPPERRWNPDAVLSVEDVKHSQATRARVDKAAATQMVFEDALFHVLDHFLRTTGCDRLVLTGGTALNCLANMRLLERYDRGWYRRNLRKNTSLNVWAPPVPGDAGVPAGAAFHFALSAGATPGEPLEHAFYCGLAPTAAEIRAALDGARDIGHLELANVHALDGLRAVADFAAFVVARDGIIGLFQGPAETGPRALGHRSILANPCNPRTLDNINRRVKFREPIRPLAPMATLRAAQELFELPAGAASANYSAFNYMVLTARARTAAYRKVPAVVHQDGTARVQIVRPEHDPFCHAYLEALGKYLGVEASVNTSLNVGSPIVQTPAQALVALQKARALSGLILLADDGAAFLAWHARANALNDAGRQLLAWHEQWRGLYGMHAAAASPPSAFPGAGNSPTASLTKV